VFFIEIERVYRGLVELSAAFAGLRSEFTRKRGTNEPHQMRFTRVSPVFHPWCIVPARVTVHTERQSHGSFEPLINCTNEKTLEKRRAMKLKKWKVAVAATLFTALAMPVGIAAQDDTAQNQKAKQPRYKLVELGTFGGPNGYQSAPAPSVNNQGIAMGAADTLIPDPLSPNCFAADCLVTHAFKSHDGVLIDLGAVAPTNSSFPNWISDSGLIVGISENGLIDPLTGLAQFQAVLWNKDGNIVSLGNFGGDESQALSVNTWGQIAGTGTNAIPDAFSENCFYPMATQMRGFLWQNGTMHDLGTLGGNDTCAYLVNEFGQISGFSYTNTVPNPASGVPTQVPFLWQGGKMVSLGTLGGTFGIPSYLNNRGQVVGSSNLAGDTMSHPFLSDRGKMSDLGTVGGNFGNATWMNDSTEVAGWATPAGDQSIRAFRWKEGKMTDLGTLGSDLCSLADAINSSGQIVGLSGDCGEVERAFLWQHGGPMLDLNTLVVPPSSGLTIKEAFFINDGGEIYASAKLPNGNSRVVLLIPCDDARGCGGPSGNTIEAFQPNSLSVMQTSTNEIPIRLTPEKLSAFRNRFRGRYAVPEARRLK
jgi:probable HAF family extracellular repeat protein